jgi:outer membrane protein
VKNISSVLRAAFLASLVTALGPLAAVAGQQVSDARVAELMQQALAQTKVSQAPAQPTRNLTMDEAVKMALDQNLDIVVGRLNPQLQDLTIAQVLGNYKPMLSSTFGDARRYSLPTTQLNGGQRVETTTATYSGGVSQSLRWTGGSVGVSFSNTRGTTNNSLSLWNPNYTSGLTATFTQPLLRNFRVDSTRQQLLTSLITREISDVQLRATVTNTLANVRNAYWDLVYGVQAVEVARASLQLAEKLVEENGMRVEIGTMAPIDVVQAQSQAATARQTLTQAEGTWHTYELVLKRLLVGSTQDSLWNATINPVDRPDARAEPVDLEAAIRKALDTRTDLQQAKANLRSNDVTVRYLRNQLLPGFDLTASYGAQGIGGNLYTRSSSFGGTVTSVDPGGYADALGTLRRLRYPSWSLSVVLSYPLGSSTADANYARAKLQVSQAQAQIRQLELQVATDVTNAALQVQNNQRSVESATAARELALRKLEAEQSKFEVGMSTNFLVIQAQRDLADAQNTELRSALNYRKSLVDFERLQQTTSSSASVTTVSTGTRVGSVVF